MKFSYLLCTAVAVSLAISGAPSEGLAQAQVQPQPQIRQLRHSQPEVYFLRGFADIFSDGLNQMGAELNARGVVAEVRGHLNWESVARKIIADRKKFGRSPIVLVGHSLGANAVIRIAEELQEQGIKVDTLITLAATAPRPVPGNVRNATNYYFETHGWGRPLVPGPGFSGRLVNKDFSGATEVGHFNIDKQRSVQAEILRTVASAIRG